MFCPPSVVMSASATPEAFDALTDDRSGLIELLGRGGGAVLGLRAQDDLRAALEVEGELG